MQFVLFLYKKLKDKTSFFYFSRVLVSILVVLSTFLITIIIFVLAGFKHEVKKNIFNFTGNYQFYQYNGQTIDFEDFSEKFSHIKGVKRLSPYVKKNILIQCNDYVEGAMLLGVNFEKNNNLSHYLCAGKLCSEGEMIVGKNLFDKLRVNLSSSTTVFSLDDKDLFMRYKIVGVFETGIDELDEKIVLCNICDLQNINGWKLNICEGINLLYEGDYKELRDTVVDYGGRLRSLEKKYIYVNDWLKILSKNGSLYMFIILFTILTNVICVLILQIFEKRRLIDILLFLGATSRQVENIFIFRNMCLVGESMLFGGLLGFLVSYLQKRYNFFTLDSSDYYLNFVPIRFDIKIFLLSFVFEIGCIMACLKLTFFFVKKK